MHFHSISWLQLPRLGSFSAGTVFTAVSSLHTRSQHTKCCQVFLSFPVNTWIAMIRDGEDGDDGVGMLMIMMINVDYPSRRVCIQADIHYSQLLASFKPTRLQVVAALVWNCLLWQLLSHLNQMIWWLLVDLWGWDSCPLLFHSIGDKSC